MDPWDPWDPHDPHQCEACDTHGVVETPSLPVLQAQLHSLPPEKGHWTNPGSLTRFGTDKMSGDQLRRFLLKVRPQQLDWHTPCWLWDGGTHEKGYGRFYLGLSIDPSEWVEKAVKNKRTDKLEIVIRKPRVHVYTHRVAFEHWIGFPPQGYIVDHQCNHKLCCNPTHLWPETNNSNLRLADQRRPWRRRNQYSKE